LPKLLNSAGIRYTILDDIHIVRAGIRKESVKGYYTTEDESQKIAVFPTDKKLRYLIPFAEIQEFFSYFEEKSRMGCSGILTYGDDGEKFGEWQGTYDLVYTKRWLECFFGEIVSGRRDIETVKFSEYLEREKPECPVYIPPSSYEEMMKWSMNNENQIVLDKINDELSDKDELKNYVSIIAGGVWKNFFIKYPESNQMHKKMIYTSKRFEKAGIRYGDGSLDEEENAIKSLYRAGCNCVYWHGLFGGIYLHHIRTAVYRELINANRILNNRLHEQEVWIETDEGDFDCDGYDEIIVSNPDISLWINPAEGGCVTEIDWIKKGTNILNTLSRKKEPYHKGSNLDELISKDSREEEKTISEDDKNLFGFDNLRRVSFAECFLDEKVKGENIILNNYGKSFLFEERNRYLHSVKKDADSVHVTLENVLNAKESDPKIIKRYSIKDHDTYIEFSCKVNNFPAGFGKKRFALEFNFSLPSANGMDNRIAVISSSLCEYDLNSVIESEDVKGIKIKSPYDSAGIEINLSQTCNLFSFPVKTASRSERGFDFNYQGTCVFFIWDVGEMNEIDISTGMSLIGGEE